MTRPIIPTFHAEYVRLVANARHRGDTSKVPTARIASMLYGKTTITSRYQKAHEIERMMDMLDHIYEWAPAIEQLFCDSQGGCYEVSLFRKSHRCQVLVAEALEYAMRRHGIGHNGITFENGMNSIGAWWPGDDARQPPRLVVVDDDYVNIPF